MTPTVKVTLQHNSGAVSIYKPASPLGHPGDGPLREAIITCIGGAPGDIFNRVELLRCDMAGADWKSLVTSKAVPELEARLKKAATDLMSGFEPHVVVTLGADRSLKSARLVTNQHDLAEALVDPNNRALVVPRLLPYQMGGSAEGASAVLYSPEGAKGIKVFSVHPNRQEALVSEQNLKVKGEAKTSTVQVETSVTSLVAAVADGRWTPDVQGNDREDAVQLQTHGTVQREGKPTAGAALPTMSRPMTMTPFEA